jgi:hypothetical protein
VLAVSTFTVGVALMFSDTVCESTLQRHVPVESLSRVGAYDWFGWLAFYPLAIAIRGARVGDHRHQPVVVAVVRVPARHRRRPAERGRHPPVDVRPVIIPRVIVSLVRLPLTIAEPVWNAVVAIPRLVGALERVADAADNLDVVADVSPLVERLVVTLETARGPIEQLAAIGPVAEGLAAAAAPLERLAGVGAPLERLAGAAASLEQLGGAVEPLTRLSEAAASLEQLGGAVEPLQRLSGTAASLERLGDAVEHLGHLAGAVAHLEQLGGAVGSLERLADVSGQLEGLTAAAERIAGVSTSLERLADASGVLPQLAGAAEELTGMPDDMRSLVTHLDKAASQLDILVNDATRLASIIERLDETITTLAATLGPLQGATERVGRIVDRLPDRRRSSLS